MTSVSEITRFEDMRVGAAQKASVVRASAKYTSEQGSDYEPGVSAETVGSKVLFLGIVTLPAGVRTKAHVHERHDTALYLLSGEIEMWTGDQLQHRELVRPGDYIYIPANVLHVAVNRGEKPAVCIGTRNEPTAQESVVLYPEMDARVP
ncbi:MULTISPECIES: cupin domain-containing protein [Bradyrhizobium]|uniref:cupin domain-containing protein n=1 Tax=Bradyrhizobium TaxID=374 RepID=UPI001EDB64C2|nr:cupin domain-containing protein [Bradyrhizobium zhengyangense]MCG2638603.1 cupin domain-containing protein [Bradyrhizobium zhengyangense]